MFLPFLVFTVALLPDLAVREPGTRDFDVDAHRELVDAWRPGRYPSLDVFLPVCGEPIAVLHNTWTHVAELARPTPAPSTPSFSTTAPTRELEAMAATSASATWRGPTAAG